MLELVNVSCGEADDYELEAISFSISSGDRLAIVGANGSGKSTLARLLVGELDPTSGTINGTYIRGTDLQTSPNLLKVGAAVKVRDVIDSTVPGAKARDVLAALALSSELIERYVVRLSEGERYRLAVALLLARQPHVLVLDAPTGTLDARSTDVLVKALSQHRGAVVILSADLSLAAEVCQHAILLSEGKIAARGSPAELLTDAELLKRHGLQLPAAVSPSWLRRRARGMALSSVPLRSRSLSPLTNPEKASSPEIAEEIARCIELGFNSFHVEFQSLTRRAARRFGLREFVEHQDDASERLGLHRKQVELSVEAVRPLLDLFKDENDRRRVWAQARHTFAQSIAWRPDSELAETYFNSVSRRVFTMIGVDDDLEFRWFGGITLPVVDPGQGEVETYRRRTSTAELVKSVLARYKFHAGWLDVRGDALKVGEAVDRHLAETWESTMPVEIDMVSPVFYRNRGAYLIGRIRHLNRVSPLVIPLRMTARGVVCDAVLLTENLTSRIFGFTRSYFHVDTKEPAALVAFVKTLIPLKPVAELYTAIGYSAHGKTSLFRAIYRHLDNSTDRFEVARGVKGMVMIVFTLPSFGVVFKVIKDTFPPSKRTSRRQIRDKYKLVFKHDRVGRMVDAQVFENLAFPKERFTQELLAELEAEAGWSVTITDDQVIIDHVYTERRVYPLDLYLREMPHEQACAAVVDYGNAIKDLSAANIFPGDLFTKNFGVTRHGSVVFYDYDELTLLEHMNFREIPTSTSYEDEISDEPWYSIGVDDVFPEEFRRFFKFPAGVVDLFEERHGDLCTAEIWRNLQRQHHDAQVPEFFPYPVEVRLAESSD